MHGSTTKIMIDAIGDTMTVETKFRGTAVYSVTKFCETVKVADAVQIFTEIQSLLDYISESPVRFDPEVKMVTDRKTGLIDRITKCWSEIN